MPQALAIMWDLLKSEMSDADKRATILEFDKIFGLGLIGLKNDASEIPAEIQQLVDERNEARQHEKWDKADDLRRQLDALGWQIEDTTDSVRVNRKGAA
jgi:cysteinyl-tRNA synthetase